MSKRRYGSITKRKYRHKSLINSPLNIEVKYLDTGSQTGITNNGTCTSGVIGFLSPITRGDGDNQRDGIKTAMLHIKVSGTFTWTAKTNQTVLPVVPNVFIALVVDKQSKGLNPLSQDIFVNPSGIPKLATSPFRNKSGMLRYNVLCSEVIEAPTISSAYDGTNIEVQGGTRSFELEAPLGGIYTKWDDISSGIIGNVKQGHTMWLVSWKSEPASQLVDIQWNSRLSFVG